MAVAQPIPAFIIEDKAFRQLHRHPALNPDTAPLLRYRRGRSGRPLASLEIYDLRHSLFHQGRGAQQAPLGIATVSPGQSKQGRPFFRQAAAEMLNPGRQGWLVSHHGMQLNQDTRAFHLLAISGRHSGGLFRIH